MAAADIMDALPVMKVSDHLTWIAEVILEQAVDRMWQFMVARHGRPVCEVDGELRHPQLGVIAYGKLAGKVTSAAVKLPGGHALNAAAAAISLLVGPAGAVRIGRA